MSWYWRWVGFGVKPFFEIKRREVLKTPKKVCVQLYPNNKMQDRPLVFTSALACRYRDDIDCIEMEREDGVYIYLDLAAIEGLQGIKIERS
jgi:hypothetical protein